MEGFQKVEHGSPDQCQMIIRGKCQCTNKKAPDSDYCPMHGGVPRERQKANNYRIERYRVRLREFTESDQVKSLRDEIGLLRILVEERFNRIDGHSDLLLHSGPLSDLIMKIEKVVVSCHKLEGSMGKLVDRAAILRFASEIVQLVTEEIDSRLSIPEIERNELIDKIGDRIMSSLENLDSQEEQNDPSV